MNQIQKDVQIQQSNEFFFDYQSQETKKNYKFILETHLTKQKPFYPVRRFKCLKIHHFQNLQIKGYKRGNFHYDKNCKECDNKNQKVYFDNILYDLYCMVKQPELKKQIKVTKQDDYFKVQFQQNNKKIVLKSKKIYPKKQKNEFDVDQYIKQCAKNMLSSKIFCQLQNIKQNDLKKSFQQMTKVFDNQNTINYIQQHVLQNKKLFQNDQDELQKIKNFYYIHNKLDNKQNIFQIQNGQKIIDPIKRVGHIIVKVFYENKLRFFCFGGYDKKNNQMQPCYQIQIERKTFKLLKKIQWQKNLCYPSYTLYQQKNKIFLIIVGGLIIDFINKKVPVPNLKIQKYQYQPQVDQKLWNHKKFKQQITLKSRHNSTVTYLKKKIYIYGGYYWNQNSKKNYQQNQCKIIQVFDLVQEKLDNYNLYFSSNNINLLGPAIGFPFTIKYNTKYQIQNNQIVIFGGNMKKDKKPNILYLLKIFQSKKECSIQQTNIKIDDIVTIDKQSFFKQNINQPIYYNIYDRQGKIMNNSFEFTFCQKQKLFSLVVSCLKSNQFQSQTFYEK